MTLKKHKSLNYLSKSHFKMFNDLKGNTDRQENEMMHERLKY